MTDNINNPYVLKVKSIHFTRASDAASGDVSYTGVGFKPKIVLFLTNVDATTIFSVGVDALEPFNIQLFNTLAYYSSTYSIQGDITGAGAGQFSIVKTLDGDGFTLTWTKLGLPAGGTTINVIAICLG